MQLRPYQSRTVEYVRDLPSRSRRGIHGPTGSGKTAIFTELLRDPCRQIVITNRCILLDQIAKTLKEFGIGYGYRASGRLENAAAPIQLVMAQTELKRHARVGLAKDIDRVHIDEVHSQRGEKYTELFGKYHAAGASILGYTATPSDLSNVVDGVYTVATVPELIQQGYLCAPRVFSCGQPDLKQLDQLRRDKYGEYLAGDVSKLIQPKFIFGRVLANYRRLSPDNRPFVLYAHSVKASIWWAQSLTAKGVPVASIDGDNVWVDGQFYKSDTAKREECFERIKSGDLQGLSNRFVLREGFDLPSIGHVINTCPVGLRKTWVQMCGRALRPYPNREYAIIQDHSGSCVNHPFLGMDTPWDWQSAPGLAEKVHQAQMRESEIPEPIMCPQCNGLRNAGDECPFCGFKYKKHARYVIQADGELRLQEGRAFQPRPVRGMPGDQKLWDRIYWRTVKNGNRTAEQAYSYFAYSNNWRWLPRNLAHMPRYQADWFVPLKSVPAARLFST